MKKTSMIDETHLYTYRATVRSVYDADTIRADIDLGLSIVVRNESLRLNRINAPEVRGEEREKGLEARDYLRNRIENQEIIVQTVRDKKGKYGRFLVEIWLKDGLDYININDELVSKGFAIYQSY